MKTSKYIIGLDDGFGDIKASIMKDGKIINKKFSSVIAHAPENAMDMPLFEGQRYYVGNIALSVGESIIERNDYVTLEKTSPLFLEKVLQEFNINPDEVALIVCSLSLAHISKVDAYKKRLTKFKISGKAYDFTDKIIITPQGVGAKYAIDHFYANSGIETYQIIDGGFNTIDSVDVIDNTLRMENIKGFKDEGVIKIARHLQEYIAKNFQETLSIKEIKEILDSKEYYVDGETHDMSNPIQEFIDQYTDFIMQTLKDRFSKAFKRYRRIYFVGGLAYYINPKMHKAIETPADAEYYNSMGNLLRGQILSKEDLKK